MQRVMTLNNVLSRLSLRSSDLSFGPLSTCRWNSTATPDSVAFLQQAAYNKQQTPRPVFQRTRPLNGRKFVEDRKSQEENRSLEKFQTREWKAGDVYAPHDLSPAEMKKWRRRQSPPTDAFDALNRNPLDLYKNFSIMSEYMTAMGRIKHRNVTGLRPVNQRKIAKAIRRAIGLGLMPSVHRHPEILAAEAKARLDGSTGY